jgi:hypothetical protein
MTKNDNTWFESSQLKEREIAKIFENIKEELALITATVKFNFTTRKTSEKDLKILLAYIGDTAKLVDLLKSRLSLLTEATS